MKCFGIGLWRLIESLLWFIFYRLLGLDISEEKWEGLLQFFKFGIVGLSNTVVSYVIYISALLAFREVGWLPNLDYLIAQFLGFVISVLWSFVLNRKFVFQTDDSVPLLQALLKTYVSYAFTGLFLNSVLSILWVEWLGVSKLIAPIFNLLISVPINFVLNKFWAFKRKCQ